MKPETDLAVVTSVHNYGAYLEDWAKSILALQRKPAVVALFEHGSTDDSPAQVDAAVALLRDGGLEVRVEHSAERLHFGAARNRAVALSGSTPWVMHFDADDMLMPHALGDVAAIADRCDVVALGYERCGDLAAGPKQRRKVYRSSSGPSVLTNSTPASGPSPYRRSFWERSPYPESMAGGWDTALWIGFGHLGARILPTRRPCFWYRQHSDSVFNTRRVASWPTALVGHELTSRRRQDAGVSVLVTRSTDDGRHREAAWRYIRDRYRRLRPAWEIVEGIAPAEPWQKGVALSAAVEKCHGKIAIVTDSDVLVDLAALDRAVEMVERFEAPWVVPHQLVHRLNAEATEAWLAAPATAEVRKPQPGELQRRPYMGFAAGGILVVRRPDLQATGGIPHQFAGWGAEDEALAVIFDTLLGKHQRLASDLVHLWHPPQTANKSLASRANRVEFSRIRSLAGEPEALWQYLADPRTFPRRTARAIVTGNGDAAWRRQAWQQRSQALRADMAQSIGDPRAAAARTRTREVRMGLTRTTNPQKKGEIVVGDPARAAEKADRRRIDNKALEGPPEDKAAAAPLRFLTAAAQFLAERERLDPEELRRRVPKGAPITMEAVRMALVARRTGRARKLTPAEAKAAKGPCGGCGGPKPVAQMTAAPPEIVQVPTEAPSPYLPRPVDDPTEEPPEVVHVDVDPGELEPEPEAEADGVAP